MLLLEHLLLTLSSIQVIFRLEVRVHVVGAGCLRVLEGTAPCDSAEILHLELLEGVSKILVLFTQGNVLPLNPLEVFDAHLELVLVVL